MARKFLELTKDFSKERRARIEAQKKELRAEMDLAELRHALELTQTTLAETLKVGQAEISKIESRADIFVSTLRKFVRAMGGELEINAVFADHSVRIKNFSSLKGKKHPKRIPSQTSSVVSRAPRRRTAPA
jgi:transcriptional regulator with XRE-family HTH domain